MVKKVATKAEFDDIIAKTSGLVIVDFFAVWCGPCQRIAPVLEQLSKENPGVVFLKVDVDENEETSTAAGVQAMPTFHVDELVGASEAKLKEMINKHK